MASAAADAPRTRSPEARVSAAIVSDAPLPTTMLHVVTKRFTAQRFSFVEPHRCHVISVQGTPWLHVHHTGRLEDLCTELHALGIRRILGIGTMAAVLSSWRRPYAMVDISKTEGCCGASGWAVASEWATSAFGHLVPFCTMWSRRTLSAKEDPESVSRDCETHDLFAGEFFAATNKLCKRTPGLETAYFGVSQPDGLAYPVDMRTHGDTYHRVLARVLSECEASTYREEMWFHFEPRTQKPAPVSVPMGPLVVPMPTLSAKERESRIDRMAQRLLGDYFLGNALRARHLVVFLAFRREYESHPREERARALKHHASRTGVTARVLEDALQQLYTASSRHVCELVNDAVTCVQAATVCENADVRSLGKIEELHGRDAVVAYWKTYAGPSLARHAALVGLEMVKWIQTRAENYLAARCG